MPEAILKFNLPEEKSDFLLSARSSILYRLILDIDNELSNINRHGSTSFMGDRFKDTSELVEVIRKFIAEEVNFQDY